MKFKSILFYLLVFTLLATSSSFANSAKKKLTNSDKAEMILKKMRGNKTSRVSFKKTRKGNRISEKIRWKKYNLDGKISTKTHYIDKNAKTGKIILDYFTLRTPKGALWEIYGDIAIKDEDMMNIQKKWILDAKKIKPLKFLLRIEDYIYKGIDCYKIISKKKSSPETITNMQLNRTIYIIGKKSYFLYFYELYSSDGKLHLSSSSDKIKKNRQI